MVCLQRCRDASTEMQLTVLICQCWSWLHRVTSSPPDQWKWPEIVTWKLMPEDVSSRREPRESTLLDPRWKLFHFKENASRKKYKCCHFWPHLEDAVCLQQASQRSTLWRPEFSLLQLSNTFRSPSYHQLVNGQWVATDWYSNHFPLSSCQHFPCSICACSMPDWLPVSVLLYRELQGT